jgi:hypothetical protein
MNRISSVEDHKLNAAYESLRETLRAGKYASRLEKPLAFWALPNDRRLPMALLGRSLRDLLARPLSELANTAGIGRKKLHSLIKLLQRATRDDPPVLPLLSDGASKKRTKARRADRGEFDPSVVSEVLWEKWRDTVKHSGLQREPLGRLAPSLQSLPTVIWRTPLETYCKYTVAEIRALKTHGEKRVRAILEVFHSVYEMLEGVPRDRHLRLHVRPTFTARIEKWINDALARGSVPSRDELKQNVVLPIIEQLRIDAGPKIVKLVEERLGVKSARQRVQVQAKRLGLTRARIYQLFEMCADIMAVRWPEGEPLFGKLYQKLLMTPDARAQLELLSDLVELIYPTIEAGNGAPPELRVADRQANREPSKDGDRRSNRDHSRNQRSSTAVSARW